MPEFTLNGCRILKSYLNRGAQEQIVYDIRDVVARAPFFRLKTRWGKPMSVRMTSCGDFGWWSDARGYRYIPTHPDGTAWPPIPGSVLDIWRNLVTSPRMPECCLINYYAEGARMGLHQDKDETDFDYPVISISLGDTARFRVGGTQRGDPTKSVQLESGDVAVLGGAARLGFHGIDRIYAGTSTLLDRGGRLNLTLRVVT